MTAEKLNPQVVILCGGRGTRLREHTESIPKPLVEIGSRPILWHIMKLYAHHGFHDFILCLGYKGELIRQYFEEQCDEGWSVTFAETGEQTQTGGRILRILPLIRGERVFVTYGDGLANLDLRRLLTFHLEQGTAATITCVNPQSPFGVVEIDASHRVRSYQEKPQLDHWISGGFFVFERRAFAYLEGDSDILERRPFEHMAADGELAGYRFNGFWTCMDTYKDTQRLNELWSTEAAPWKLWVDEPARPRDVAVLG